MKRTEPIEGRFPGLIYEYTDGWHVLRCDCCQGLKTTDPLTARRFAQFETGRHARGRIVNPEEES